MITREEMRELSQFRFNENEQCAISFYFQPATPRNKSHREESILVKDLVRNALRQLAANGNNHCARADLERIMTLCERLSANQSRAKAIFAYGRENFWREFDLPPKLLLVAQPTRGVDIGAIEFIHRKLVSLRDAGCAILLVSAELEEVTALADRLMVIHQGCIVGEVDPKTTSMEEIGLMMTGGHVQV